jgi:hypothetical protein
LDSGLLSDSITQLGKIKKRPRFPVGKKGKKITAKKGSGEKARSKVSGRYAKTSSAKKHPRRRVLERDRGRPHPKK